MFEKTRNMRMRFLLVCDVVRIASPLRSNIFFEGNLLFDWLYILYIMKLF